MCKFVFSCTVIFVCLLFLHLTLSYDSDEVGYDPCGYKGHLTFDGFKPKINFYEDSHGQCRGEYVFSDTITLPLRCTAMTTDKLKYVIALVANGRKHDVLFSKKKKIEKNVTITKRDDGKEIICSCKKNDDVYTLGTITVTLKYVEPTTTTTTITSTGCAKKTKKRGLIPVRSVFEKKITKRSAEDETKKANLIKISFLRTTSAVQCKSQKLYACTESTYCVMNTTGMTINYAWCSLLNNGSKLNNNFTLEVTNNMAYILTRKEYEGRWNCSFLVLKQLSTQVFANQRYLYKNETYVITTCIFNVDVLTKPSNSTAAATTTTTRRTTKATTTTRRTTKTATTTRRTTKATTTTTTLKYVVTTKKSKTTSTPKKKPISRATTEISTTTSNATTEVSTTINTKKSAHLTTILKSNFSYNTASNESDEENTDTSTSATTNAVTTENPDSEKSVANNTSPFGSNKWWLWVVAAALAIFTMCLCFFCVIRCRKLDKGIKVKPDATYENLSNERQFPPNLESNYARPFDRIDEEPQYACTSQESPYSVPYNEKDINKLYARPTPKNQRQKPAQDLYSEVVPKRLRKNEVTYADIEFNSNKKKTNVKNDEPLYSEIQKEDNYANLNPKQNPRYDNVINGGRYVNANTSEYAEPAYCELGNVKR